MLQSDFYYVRDNLKTFQGLKKLILKFIRPLQRHLISHYNSDTARSSSVVSASLGLQWLHVGYTGFQSADWILEYWRGGANWQRMGIEGSAHIERGRGALVECMTATPVKQGSSPVWVFQIPLAMWLGDHVSGSLWELRMTISVSTLVSRRVTHSALLNPFKP